jgi:hypothetical protein
LWKSDCELNSFVQKAVYSETFDHGLVIDNSSLLFFRSSGSGVGETIRTAENSHQRKSSFVFGEVFFKGKDAGRGKEV